MIYGYARVSSVGQLDGTSLDSQFEMLQDAGCEKVFVEQFTGMTAERPQFEKLVSSLSEGDTLVVTRLDRFARSTIDGITTVRELLGRGVSVRVLNMGLIDDTPVGHLILTVMFAIAEFDHDMILERTSNGKQAARQRPGFREGRPRAEFSDKELEAAREALKSGKSAAAKVLGVSRNTVYRMIEDGRLAS